MIFPLLRFASHTRVHICTNTDHSKRVSNCLQTLCALFYGIFKKQSADVGIDVINTIFDFQEIEDKMKKLIIHCNNLLISKFYFIKIYLLL